MKPKRCPTRNLKHIEPGRLCRKSCRLDSDCEGQIKKCVCDDECGMSCFNPGIWSTKLFDCSFLLYFATLWLLNTNLVGLSQESDKNLEQSVPFWLLSV